MLENYPLSTHDGKTIPLEVARPLAAGVFSLTNEPLLITLPKEGVVFTASTDRIAVLDFSDEEEPVSPEGLLVPKVLVLRPYESTTLQAPAPSCKAYGFAGQGTTTLILNLITRWVGTGLDVNLRRR